MRLPRVFGILFGLTPLGPYENLVNFSRHCDYLSLSNKASCCIRLYFIISSCVSFGFWSEGGELVKFDLLPLSIFLYLDGVSLILAPSVSRFLTEDEDWLKSLNCSISWFRYSFGKIGRSSIGNYIGSGCLLSGGDDYETISALGVLFMGSRVFLVGSGAFSNVSFELTLIKSSISLGHSGLCWMTSANLFPSESSSSRCSLYFNCSTCNCRVSVSSISTSSSLLYLLSELACSNFWCAPSTFIDFLNC